MSLKDSMIRNALALQIKSELADLPESATQDDAANRLAGFAIARLELLLSTLEWYRDATNDERLKDFGRRARSALLGEPLR